MSGRVLTITATVVALVLIFVAVVFAVDASRDDEIAEGIRIGAVDVGGMKADEARARIERELGADVRRRVRLRYRAERYVLRPDVAQARLDVEGTVEAARRKGRDGSSAFGRFFGGGDVKATVAPKITYSRGAVEAFVGRIAKRVDEPARDADIDIHDGKLSRQKARNGVSVKRGELLAALVKRMTGARQKGDVEVPVKITERPDLTLADLAKRYPIVIAVDRDAKELRLYKKLGLEQRYDIAVGQGGFDTAAGRYKIEEKVVNPPWHAPNSEWAGELAGKTIPPGDPRNPLEARWMGFHDGQGIHGTADIASLGTAASHGCIRMSVPAVKRLFREVKVGTPLFLQ
ncbi:MAG: L,D-transpeptidase family protein [Solirubrobacteraceae bacterium]